MRLRCGISEVTAVFGKFIGDCIRTNRNWTANPGYCPAVACCFVSNWKRLFCVMHRDGTLYPAELTLHSENGTIRKIQIRTVLRNEFTEVRMSLHTQKKDT